MPAFLIPLPDWNGSCPSATAGVQDSRGVDGSPGSPISLEGITLQAKGEHHLTLANSALVAQLQRAVPGDALAWLQGVWEAGDTRILRTGRLILLHKRPDRAPYRDGSWSLVEQVIVPGQAAFLRRLERQLGRQLPRPPSHVTTHVAGRTVGIGLPRAGLLKRYRRAAAGHAE